MLAAPNPLSPFLAAHPKNTPLNPIIAAHPKSLDLKSFSCRTYETTIGGGSLFQADRSILELHRFPTLAPSPSSPFSLPLLESALLLRRILTLAKGPS